MTDKSLIETYNKIAEEFSTRNAVTIYGEEYKIFKSYIKGNKILEIGCGTGRDAEELVKYGFDYTGVDASEGMLKIAKDRVKGVPFQVGDFYKLNFADNSFDGFWAAASFLHVPKKEIDSVIQEAKRILKPSGVGFISVKEKTTIDEGVIKENRAGGIERFYAFYDKDEFKSILERNGFEVLEVTVRQENNESKQVWFCYFVRKSNL